MNFLEKLRLKFYNKSGLNHTLEHLESVFDQIPFWSLKKQAKYADHVVQKHVNDAKFIQEQFPHTDRIDTTKFDQFNTTGIGNLAYIALNCTNPDIQMHCKRVLVAYNSWKLKQTANLKK